MPLLPPPPAAVLFDLDGTLLDHFRVIARCVRFAQRALGLPESDDALVRRTVGGSAPVTLAKLCGPEHAERAHGFFQEHFREIMLEDAVLLPGAVEAVRAARAAGYRAAVLTNKTGEVSRNILRHLGVMGEFDGVFGHGDTPWRKPARELTLAVLERLGVAAAHIVGDSPWDIETARNAGLTVSAVATGTHTREQLGPLAPDALFDDLHQWRAAALG